MWTLPVVSGPMSPKRATLRVWELSVVHGRLEEYLLTKRRSR